MSADAGEQPNIHDATAQMSPTIDRVEHVNRTAIGSLAGMIDLSGDWDSSETNAEIAADFGTSSSAC